MKPLRKYWNGHLRLAPKVSQPLLQSMLKCLTIQQIYTLLTAWNKMKSIKKLISLLMASLWGEETEYLVFANSESKIKVYTNPRCQLLFTFLLLMCNQAFCGKYMFKNMTET